MTDLLLDFTLQHGPKVIDYILKKAEPHVKDYLLGKKRVIRKKKGGKITKAQLKRENAERNRRTNEKLHKEAQEEYQEKYFGKEAIKLLEGRVGQSKSSEYHLKYAIDRLVDEYKYIKEENQIRAHERTLLQREKAKKKEEKLKKEINELSKLKPKIKKIEKENVQLTKKVLKLVKEVPAKDIYCGIGPVTKGRRTGTMKECAEKKQIRQYGLKKIDPKLLKHAEKSIIKGNESRDKLAVKMVGLRARVKKLKDSGTKKELEKAEDELFKIQEKFNQLNMKR